MKSFDLRLPLGLLFGFYGVVLTVLGVVSDSKIYERSLGLNINLIWGVVLVIFAAFMLFMAFRASKKPPEKS